ncbi:MAG: hypothetical protein L0332_10085 [Chloroflexi bacterium]|nr:hypothetical protein [Chloroflexota bacterium]MCI0578898.1 hypothetical protein [Chloroflexota bacterium]MCI0649139.1 hypothetical protein [Chloroflexota bacterium]MCI0727054.1 hypothetical protein [Chloroflexota bacterium]
MSMNVQLQQAIAAARAGKKAQAQVLLARVLKDEPDNVHGWFLLSTLVDSPEQQIRYLNKVLEIDPTNVRAREHLAQLGAESTTPEPPLAQEEPTPEPVAPVPPSSREEDMEEATAWLEQLAARQGAPAEELTTGLEWLEEETVVVMGESPADLMEMEEAPASEEPALTPARPAISDKSLDLLSQAEADTIPAWLAGDEEFIGGVTPATEAPTVVDQPPPELTDLPDWLQSGPAEEWLEKESPGKGKVLWKAGEGEASLSEAEKPAAPAPAARRSTRARQEASQGSSNVLLGVLVVLFLVVFLVLAYFVLNSFA